MRTKSEIQFYQWYFDAQKTFQMTAKLNSCADMFMRQGLKIHVVCSRAEKISREWKIEFHVTGKLGTKGSGLSQRPSDEGSILVEVGARFHF